MIWPIITPILWIVALYLSLVYAPTDVVLGASQRIFYIHIGAAWVSAVAFFVTLMLSIIYLKTRKDVLDAWAAASAEVGTVFTTVVLVTGSIWGRVAWGVWWTWDPRLTTTIVLWFLYLGYLVFREAIDDRERRQVYSAVYAILAFVSVPITFLSVTWWRTIHPIVISEGKFEMPGAMVFAMMAFFVAFLSLYLDWMGQRARQHLMSEAIAAEREHAARR